MSASTNESPFKTGQQVLEERRAGGSLAAMPLEPGAEAAVRAGGLLVAPEIELERMKEIWNVYFQLKGFLLDDPVCYDVIAGRKEMNRTGATRLAMAFGLSFEQRLVNESRVDLADTNEHDYRYRVIVRVGKGGRFVDGIGSCRLSEIEEKTAKGEDVPVSKREHFALTRASTRATKRAIADILGGTEAD